MNPPLRNREWRGTDLIGINALAPIALFSKLAGAGWRMQRRAIPCQGHPGHARARRDARGTSPPLIDPRCPLLHDRLGVLICGIGGRPLLGTAYLSTPPPVLYSEPTPHVTSNTVGCGYWEAPCPRPMTQAISVPVESRRIVRAGSAASRHRMLKMGREWTMKRHLALLLFLLLAMAAFAQEPSNKVTSFGSMAPTPQGAGFIHHNTADETSTAWFNNWVKKDGNNYRMFGSCRIPPRAALTLSLSVRLPEVFPGIPRRDRRHQYDAGVREWGFHPQRWWTVELCLIW